MRRIAAGLLIPIAGALLVCALASIWPLRLDMRSLQDIARVQDLSLPRSSGKFVFLSRDNSFDNARIATFGLAQLTFPDGAIHWALLKEHCTERWSTGFIAVDPRGEAYAITSGRDGNFQWRPALNDVQPLIGDSIVVYDSAGTRAQFEARWPFLRSAPHVVVIPNQTPSHFLLRHPASELTLQRVARISCLFGSCVALMLALTRLRWNGWVIIATAIPLSVAINYSLIYLLRTHWATAILWLLLLLIPGEQVAWTMPRRAVMYALACYALLFLLRLDFDGDFFNNWLPQARYHYLLGRHDPGAIRGSIHAASYPPGYGIVLSTVMWASGMNPRESFLAGGDSSFAILLYRLLIFALNAALLYLLSFCLKQRALWIAAIVATLFLIPTTAARHIASETLLFPLLATSIVLIDMGRNEENRSMMLAGVALAAMGTLVKWEGTLIASLAVVPWLFPMPRGSKWRLTAIACAAFIPTLIWKVTLSVHNAFFVPVTYAHFVAALPQLPLLVSHAVRMTLDDGRLFLLVVALPIAVAMRRRQLAIPLGIAALCTGFIVIFLFSNIDAVNYLDTSYPRLIMVPVFGAILYCAEAVRDAAV